MQTIHELKPDYTALGSLGVALQNLSEVMDRHYLAGTFPTLEQMKSWALFLSDTGIVAQEIACGLEWEQQIADETGVSRESVRAARGRSDAYRG
jgi:hypothetical protein